MTTPDYPKALAAAREAHTYVKHLGMTRAEAALGDLLGALDAARGEAVLHVKSSQLWDARVSGMNAVRADHQDSWTYDVPLFAAPPAALAVPADNVTPMRQPRADLARLVESINAAVYANGDGLSVTEAIGALELAKLELLKEQEQ